MKDAGQGGPIVGPFDAGNRSPRFYASPMSRTGRDGPNSGGAAWIGSGTAGWAARNFPWPVGRQMTRDEVEERFPEEGRRMGKKIPTPLPPAGGESGLARDGRAPCPR